MEKYHKTDIAPIEKENERDENYKASNPQIDSERTDENYHLIRREESYTEYINKRIESLSLPNRLRKDAVLMDSFVISSDGEFFKGISKEERKQFFIDSAKFFADRYGIENVISAVVHLDETTPHMHLNIIPITDDGRLCSKDMFEKGNLSKLQTEFHKAVGEKYGLKRGKEGSQKEHLSTAEFKAKKIKENAVIESLELMEANDLAKKHFDDTMKDIKAVKEERDKIVAERNKEADYSEALNNAKNGKIAHTHKGLTEQVVSLKVENERLEKENTLLKKDNGGLFKELNKRKIEEGKLAKAVNALSFIREKEPEAFARAFYRLPSVIEPFIEDERPSNLSKSRLEQIQEEIEKEKPSTQEDKSHDFSRGKAD